MSDLMTMDEVSELLRQPVATLRYWRNRGLGPASVRMGRRVLYQRADVEAYIAEQFADARSVAGAA